ncbi:carbohydrate kinase family protein [Actinomadura sp. HBU206391]|uniref:carbohydrate kinase family protein n=1 Tax=Actinomadura sp. HBU206391 TaxID=2731692 RepID=UPI00164EEC73|nr:carbohydrate kinase family protein [Actinomadura sp. HBU206391]MBC6460262.1 carbohydrate kinase family protein [Actinomadura sp. HBU206391]
MTVDQPILTVGELTIDDVVVEDQSVDWKQPGGGALYSAVGALLWHGHSAICSAVGPDYPQSALDRLGRHGIDTSSVLRTTECNSIGLWLLYENSGARHQFEKSAGGTFERLDGLRPSVRDHRRGAAGVHLAPQSSAGHLRARAECDGLDVPVSLDLLIESYIDCDPYHDGEVFSGLAAFLPSEQEVVSLWGHADVARLRDWLRARGFAGHLVVKRGERGVAIAVDGDVVTVPAAPADVLDPTGAGDAFCGGFLAGLVATGDPILAAQYGVVSSSFVVETRGAFEALDALDDGEACRRLASVKKSVRRLV